MTTDDDRTHGGIYPDLERIDAVIREMPAVGFGAHYVDAVRAARDALAALSSPPADDVREALLAVRDEIIRNGGKADAACLATLEIIASRFEARARGAVTDTFTRERIDAAAVVLPSSGGADG